ncbi:MAG: amino acid adenylation domain-containing protein, partial [Bacteroidetes bacterium]
KFEFATALFKKESVQKMAERFNNLLKHIIYNQKAAISQIHLLNPQQQQEVISNFSHIHQEHKIPPKTIYGLINEVANKHPEKLAVIDQHRSITYQELIEQADRLKNILLNHGAKKGDFVATWMERSIESLTAFTAVSQLGAIYQPLEKQTPTARVELMLQETNCRLVLCTPQTALEFPLENPEKISISYPLPEQKVLETENISTQDPAYIIYTSGSTGKPKGVLVGQGSVTHIARAMQNAFEILPEDRLSYFASQAFDASVIEILMTISAGAALVCIPETAQKTPELFTELIHEHQVNICQLPPTFLSLLHPEKIIGQVKTLITAGEAPKSNDVKNYSGNLNYFNAYGPTETSVCSSYYLIPKDSNEKSKIPIGKTLPGVNHYILDDAFQPVPEGITGELYISGAGMSLGYLHRDELNRERFIQNPFIPGQIMYKTGDLARWTPEGDTEFMGRADFQVKIRGHRIELGEIEIALKRLDNISDAIVLDKKDAHGDQLLISFLISEDEINSKDIREQLSKGLPQYMIPNHFIRIEKIPITANGKVDRKELLQINTQTSRKKEPVDLAKLNETQRYLFDAWSHLLGQVDISLEDNFFELGGNSLKAMQILAKVQANFQISITFKDFFNHPSISELSDFIDRQNKEDHQQLSQVEEAPYYPVSAAQKRMYLLQAFDQGASNYNIPVALRIQGNMDRTRFERAFGKLIEKHESLRTRFEIRKGEPVQIIENSLSFSPEYGNCTEKEIESEVNNFFHAFKLNELPLFKVKLLEIQDGGQVLLLDLHHIISDGVSMNFLIKDLVASYQGKELSPLPFQYKDFAVWQKNHLEGPSGKTQEEYWLEQLGGNLPVIELPLDFERPPGRYSQGGVWQTEISAELSQRIRDFAQEQEATPFITLFSAFNILLSRYSGQQDIIVGTPVSGRSITGIEEIIGMFVNTLALRSHTNWSQSFRENIQSTRKNVLEAFSYQDYPFDLLVEKLVTQTDGSHNPIFDVFFSYQNAVDTEIMVEDLTFEAQDHQVRSSKFDLCLNVLVGENGSFIFSFLYRKDLFKESRIERMAVHFEQLLEEALRQPEQALSGISIKTKEELDTVRSFGIPQQSNEITQSIPELFDKISNIHSEKLALFCDNNSWTYGKLRKESNKLANYLIKKGINPEDKIALLCERSPEMIMCTLAILKAGACYVPIEANSPEKRLKHQLEDSACPMILIPSKSSFEVENISVIQVGEIDLSAESDRSPQLDISPQNLAYMMYTSGSTGVPKGVLIEQASIIRLVRENGFLEISPKDRLFQSGSLSFDASTFDIWGTLLNGASLHLLSEEKMLNAQSMIHFFKEQQINISWLTASYFNQLIDDYPELFEGLEYLLVGGDRLSVRHIRKLKELYPDINVINGYGPTENTTFTCCHLIEKTDQGPIPIGKPIAQTEVLVLDSYHQLCGIGIPGEICIAGTGLARSYLNAPELNQEKFVAHPFNAAERIYKSGDIGFWDEEGLLHFIGRKDEQLKIRGYRVELNEIEDALKGMKSIQDAAVKAFDDESGQKFLCAYYLSGEEISNLDFRQSLKSLLPEYMIPTYFQRLDHFALTKNGKKDLSALKKPVLQRNEQTPDHESPRIQFLTQAWEEILRIPRPGQHENFFDLGGHSLKAAQIINRIREEWNIELSIKDIFEHPSIEELDLFLAGKNGHQQQDFPKLGVQENYPASYAQQRLWISDQMNPEGAAAFNIPFSFKLKGNLDIDRLKVSCEMIMHQQGALKTRFEESDSELVQILEQAIDLPFESIQSGDQQIQQEDWCREQIERAAQHRFDLRTAPLWFIKVYQGETEHLVCLNFHHIISDGWSMQLFSKLLLQSYHELGQNPNFELPDLDREYTDYAAYHRIQIENDPKQKDFWLHKLGNSPSPINLPESNSRPAQKRNIGGVLRFELKKSVADQLKSLAQELRVSEFTIFRTILNLWIYQKTACSDIIVGTPSAGRAHAMTQEIIGYFINMLPLRDQLRWDMTVRECIQQFNKTNLDALAHETYPFDLMLNDIQYERQLDRSPLFDLGISWQNFDELEELEKFSELEIKTIKGIDAYAKYDLWLFGQQSSQSYACMWEYNKDLFDEQTIQLYRDEFLELSERLPEILDQKLISIRDGDDDSAPEDQGSDSEASFEFNF